MAHTGSSRGERQHGVRRSMTRRVRREINRSGSKYVVWVRSGMEGADAEVVTFIPEKAFKGSKLGWAFKLGEEGLGYYQEGMIQRTQISLQQTRPMAA